MAALNNVKLMTVTNGDVTEVEFEGKTYTKTDETPRKGDIGYRVGSSIPSTVTKGEYYQMLDGEEEKTWYIDDAGDRVYSRSGKSAFIVFRHELTEGDKVTVVGTELTDGKYEMGDVLTVKEVNPQGVYVEEFDTPGLFHREVRLSTEEEIEEAAEKAEAEKQATTKATEKRKAMIGEKILIVDEYVPSGYKNGDVLTVNGYHHDGVRTEEVEIFIRHSEYEVVTGKLPVTFEEGDVVRVEVDGDPRYSWGHVENKDIGIVDRVDADTVFVDFPRQKFWTALPSELVLVAKAEDRTDVE